MGNQLPMNVPVEYIFTVFWKSLEPEKGLDSYMSVVYHVTYVDEITPALSASSSVIDVKAQTVEFDARETVFTASQSKKGIIFRWKCPDIFQDYCDEWEGSPTMAIPPQVFKTYGGEENVDYTFTIHTYTMMIGGEPTMSAQVFSKSVSIRWAQVQKPVFSIALQKYDDNTPDVVFVTKRNEFVIDLENYRSSDPILEFSYTINPQV